MTRAVFAVLSKSRGVVARLKNYPTGLHLERRKRNTQGFVNEQDMALE